MNVLLDILVVLIAAKVAAEVAERVGVPAVVGEILAGILIGPSVFGLVGGDEVLRVLGELGVILLLLDVGLQMDLDELGAVGRSSVLVAAVGVVAPFALGWGATSMLGYDGSIPMFVGAALTATSVGITARVFGDLRALASVEARTVLGAAVVDDVFGLVILTIVVRMATGDSVTALSVAGVVGLALAFLALTGSAGVKLAPPFFGLISNAARSAGTLVAIVLAFTLGFSELARLAGLAPIVGAFVAGLSLARSSHAERIRRELTPVGHLFIPVFFLQIGIDADIGQFAHPAVLTLAAVLMMAAVAGKLLSPLGALGARGDKLLMGLGMLPRGEVGLIFAGLGLREGILGKDVYAALLLVVLATTLLAPPLLRWRLHRLRSSQQAAAPPSPMPEGGWLRIDHGVIVLEGRPGPHLALDLALEAAVLAIDARPGTALLDWLTSVSEAPLRWDSKATGLLFRVLTEGNSRSWRLLEATGVLDRALPEMAETFRRRRSDPFELDPVGLMRWSLVERINELVAEGGEPEAQYRQMEHPEWLRLAALILEAAGDGESPVEAARRLVKRLDLGASAEQEIALLVGESELLRATARRPDALTKEAVLPVALHLDRAERARALYLLSLALGGLDVPSRQRLDELARLVLAALAHPELTGRPARNLVERRRSEAARLAGIDSPAAARAATAPLGYVLAQDSATIARQIVLLDPLLTRQRTRIAVTEGSVSAEWLVDVAARDQHGLFAAITAVLAAADLDVTAAILATWPDGALLDGFRTSGTSRPDAAGLERALVAAFGLPLEGAPAPDAEVSFDDAGSPWYTRAEVRATDRPGLLHSLAVAFARADVEVHSATVETSGGAALDRFELTDRRGAKLDGSRQDAIRAALADGSVVKGRRLRAPNGARTVGTNSKHSGHRTETGVS
ncbi:MAG: cation:proton antiporter [Acidimicrobiales bacterium]